MLDTSAYLSCYAYHWVIPDCFACSYYILILAGSEHNVSDTSKSAQLLNNDAECLGLPTHTVIVNNSSKYTDMSSVHISGAGSVSSPPASQPHTVTRTTAAVSVSAAAASVHPQTSPSTSHNNQVIQCTMQYLVHEGTGRVLYAILSILILLKTEKCFIGLIWWRELVVCASLRPQNVTTYLIVLQYLDDNLDAYIYIH